MNFYNDAYARAGFDEPCQAVRRLWLEGDRPGAIAAGPDDRVRATTLFGDEAHVRERLSRYRDCGIAELTLHPVGGNTRDRLDTLGRAVELVREVSGVGAPGS